MANESGRLASLDVFRGITIAGMVLVNDPGSTEHIYPPLRHAAWSGWTPTDWIFPFFLFIVGVAMTFSFAKRLERGARPRDLAVHVLRRATILFALGLFVNGFPFWLDPNFSLATWRIPGVLQRIAICYAVASFILLRTSPRSQAWWIVGLYAAYWLIVKLVPVPGYGAGLFEPTGNIAWYFDSTLLSGHTWISAPAPGFDPEGILSTLPSIGTTLLGVLTGHWLRSDRSPEVKTAWMFVAGNALLFAGVVVSVWLPINKNMWTPSFSLFTGGWALVGLAICVWLIDVNRIMRWSKPFTIFGMNAIAAYVFSEVLWTTLWSIRWTGSGGATVTLHEWIYDGVFSPVASPVNASLLFAIAFVLATYLVVFGMWKKKWFLKF